MRRTTEHKESEQPTHPACSDTSLEDDDVSRKSSKVRNRRKQYMNYHAVQDMMCYYASGCGMPNKEHVPPVKKEPLNRLHSQESASKEPPNNPPNVAPTEKQPKGAVVGGRKICSACNHELTPGRAILFQTLQIYFHVRCFLCSVCHAKLAGTEVRVKSEKLYCVSCFSKDKDDLRFSSV